MREDEWTFLPRAAWGFFMSDQKSAGTEKFMSQAVQTAVEGKQRVSPNPRVGALIVRNGKIVGKGRHERFGGPHAEVNAIRDAGSGVKGAEMYVTLEPCCHTGKTPPCTGLIIRSGIKKVYIGMEDPNPLVAGSGISQLRAAGIAVTTNVLNEECVKLNQPFIKMMKRRFPYIIAKAATTLDGYIADIKGNSKWISSGLSRKAVHSMRAEADAVLVGMGTVIADDPELTVRNAAGDNPLRVVFDPGGRLQVKTKLVKSAAETPLYVITGTETGENWKQTLRAHKVNLILSKEKGRAALKDGLKQLGALGIQSILAEGGGKLHSMLAELDIIDRLELFIAAKLLGDGVRMMKIPPRRMPDPAVFLSHRWRQSGEDMHFTGIIKHYE